MKTYNELITLPTFEERVNYLREPGKVGKTTFGGMRSLETYFYTVLDEWKAARMAAIRRDKGCDLGMDGYDICGSIYVHHIVPITREDLISRNPRVLALDNLISCSDRTHRAIHYGCETGKQYIPVERKPYDTCPWRKVT